MMPLLLAGVLACLNVHPVASSASRTTKGNFTTLSSVEVTDESVKLVLVTAL